MRKLVGSVLVSLATTAVAVALLAPAASASPIGDAEAAIMAAWEKAGGDTSPLGARKGDVYPVGDGFALDFDGGRMFYTTSTGANFAFGPILDKYESLGGPAGSDLGFPTINEVPGLAGPDSRVSTFSASDKPVIFWTPDHGAFVVRGALNAAWDKLGSSGGVLGAPVGDETYDGEVASQKFSGGQVSWNRQTKEFATEPAALADQLKGLQVPIDPTAAINMAWRAAGGANGPLGNKQGGQYPLGGDGIVQDFAGGKVFFTPATGANAVEKDILGKYESLGGPVGSDLGFPTGNESDGGTPNSRMCSFSGADKPLIFWTQDHGAFVVRGAMRVAWDKLRGPAGKLGAPVGDQAVDGDVVSQQFTGGKISWNRAKNTFSTDPANLASLLSGLQVPGQNQASGSAVPAHSKSLAWQSWWPLAAIPVLVLIALSVLATVAWRRRRRSAHEDAAYQPDPDLAGYDTVDPRWGHEDDGVAAEHYPHPADEQPADGGPAARVSWRRGAGAPVAGEFAAAGPYADEAPASAEEGAGHFEDVFATGEEDPDTVDTDSIPVVSEELLAEEDYPEIETAHPDDAEEVPYTEAADGDYPDVAVPRTPPDAFLAGGGPDTALTDEEYPDLAVPHATPAFDSPEAAAPVSGVSETDGADADEFGEKPGRHAAADAEDGAESAPPAANAALAPAGRPTIHLPLDDPYQVPDGYPIKASARFGLYYTPGSELYHDTLAEIWLASEEVAQANGFIKAD
jgi:uncharacterized protein with LGFP repeats